MIAVTGPSATSLPSPACSRLLPVGPGSARGLHRSACDACPLPAVTLDSTGVAQTVRSRAAAPFRTFAATQNASAVVLLGATVVALVWANVPWGSTYENFWTTDLSIRLGDSVLSLDLRHWVNDGLMTFFFFVVGLEIRREFDMGELRERRRLATPVVAAIGGMVAPALLYLAFTGGTDGARGWGIVMGTDTAFALGVLALVGRGCPPRIRVFLLTLVIVDDIIALTVIALVYTDDVSIVALVVAFALFGVAVVMRRWGIHNGVAYFVVSVGLWVAMVESGVHPTIAGIALGLLATAYPPSRADLDRAGTLWRRFREQPTPEYARSTSAGLRLSVSPNERLQHLIDPWVSFLVVPLFALANAGIELNGDVLERSLSSSITLGIIVGLVVGKLVGITAATWLGSRRWLGRFPLTIAWPPLVGAATVAGIGFTVALLIADLSFHGVELEEAKLGILGASIVATALSFVVFRVIGRLPERVAASGAPRVAPPIVDLSDPVDRGRDHVRGGDDAPVTLVEYADFECPYCGRTEPLVRDLVASYGTDLRYVFRHLPLTDVHEHAELAAEAAEAAGAAGKFWEMHDRLFAGSDALGFDDLLRYAGELDLDVDQFADALRSRKYALRVARDVESADDNGVAGTPTFFVNGRRHHGAYDLDSLREAIDRELRARSGSTGAQH
jgi:Na+/H+ antiporter NhaA